MTYLRAVKQLLLLFSDGSKSSESKDPRGLFFSLLLIYFNRSFTRFAIFCQTIINGICSQHDQVMLFCNNLLQSACLRDHLAFQYKIICSDRFTEPSGIPSTFTRVSIVFSFWYAATFPDLPRILAPGSVHINSTNLHASSG